MDLVIMGRVLQLSVTFRRFAEERTSRKRTSMSQSVKSWAATGASRTRPSGAALGVLLTNLMPNDVTSYSFRLVSDSKGAEISRKMRKKRRLPVACPTMQGLYWPKNSGL